ncbi:MAG: hypothetical protein ACK56W_01350 [Pirellula sp.]|jgi:hypothetical protein|nr:hypothetical protein [Pirellula sp.]
MNNTNPYQSTTVHAPISTLQNSHSLLRSACLGAVSAAFVPLIFAIFAIIMAFGDISNVRSIRAIWIWAVLVLASASVGALLGIAVGMFRRTLIKTDRRLAE